MTPLTTLTASPSQIDQRLADRDHAYDTRFATIEPAIRDLVQANAAAAAEQRGGRR